jgi:glycosyltransferase involved in cell wall biosynthesis
MSLTVIIPVYNTSEYLEKCFNSLITDKYKYVKELGLKVVFVNDGSTDNSLEILNELANNNSFVTIINQENLGLSLSRNNAMSIVDTEYFLFLDSDDRLKIKEIVKLLKIAKSDDLDLLSYGLEYFNENNVLTGRRAPQQVPHNKILDGKEALLLNYNPSSACLYLYKTTFIKDNNFLFFPNITQQDVEFTVRLFIKAKKVYFVYDVCYEYFRRTDSITKTKNDKQLKKYLSDSIIVATNVKKNIDIYTDKEMESCIKKNYNSIVWNLLWRFYTEKDEVSYQFKKECIKELKEKELYPIKGSLKTPFQKISRVFFNSGIFINYFIK